jgi:hypothetical protein
LEKKFASEKEQMANYAADLSQSFTIILADSTELSVRLMAVSADHDLALLKLDGLWGSTLLKRSPANSKAWGLPSPFNGLTRSSAAIWIACCKAPIPRSRDRATSVSAPKSLYLTEN